MSRSVLCEVGACESQVTDLLSVTGQQGMCWWLVGGQGIKAGCPVP